MYKTVEMLAHTADIKLKIYGETFAQLMSNAVVGMFQCIRPRAQGCHVEHGWLVCDALPQQHMVDVESGDRESLLVDFLSRALYLSDVYNEAYLRAQVHDSSATHVHATLYGVKITGFEVVEIKAVTYHDISVKELNGQWQAEVVFDI